MEHSENRTDFSRRGAAAHPHQALLRRGLRELPPHQVRGREALLARRRREPDPDAGRDARGRAARCGMQGGRDRHGPPRPPQRADATSSARRRTRSSASSRARRTRKHVPRPRRREVPHGLLVATTPRAAGRTIHLSLAFNPSHLEVGGPGGRGPRARQAGPQRRHRAHARACRCSSTATRPSSGQGVVAETLNLVAAPRLRHRRHRPPRHQQPGRLHHRPADVAHARIYCHRASRRCWTSRSST